jgi:hypothetical protein
MKKISWLPILLLIPNFVFGAGQDDLKEGKALLVAGDYDKAFPLLAKSGDKLLAPLAELELSKPTDFMATAATYKDAVKKAPAALKLTLVDRMVFWYGKKWHSTVDEKEKAELRKIFNQIEPVPPGADKFGKPGPQLSGWNWDYKFACNVEQEFARSGKFAGKVVSSDPPPAGRQMLATIPIPAAAGKTYTLTAWVFSTANVDAGCGLQLLDMDGGTLKQVGKGVPQDSPFWQKVSTEVVAPEGTFRIVFSVVAKGMSKGAIWIDDVSIKMDGAEVLKNGGFEGK